MNYIYDILINLNKKYYDFFEWNQSDTIYHIRKIPIFRIKSNDFLNLLSSSVSVDSQFVELIKNKTDVFNNTPNDLRYCCLLTDSNDVMAISFDEYGNTIGKSDLLIEEALDVLEISLHIKESSIKYKILKNDNNCDFLTRNTSKMQSKVLKKIDLLANDDTGKLKYLYYECFNEEEIDRKKMLEKIKKNIINEDILKKLNKFFKLISNYK